MPQLGRAFVGRSNVFESNSSRSGSLVIVPALVDSLVGQILRQDAIRIKKFLNDNPAQQYFIASDYVSGSGESPSDAFAYTIYPCRETYEEIVSEIRKSIPRDLKQLKTHDIARITDQLVDCIASQRRFNLCFFLNKNRAIFTDRQHRIEMAKMWNEVYRKVVTDYGPKFLPQLRSFEQRMQSKNLNERSLQDVIIASTIAGVIAFLITRYAPSARSIIWGSDRGEIISGFYNISAILFPMNWAGACNRNFSMRPGVELISVQEGQSDRGWYDELVRIPDYLAGTLAAIDPNTGLFKPDSNKHQVAFMFLLCGDKQGKRDWYSNTRIYRLSIRPNSLSVESITFGPRVHEGPFLGLFERLLGVEREA